MATSLSFDHLESSAALKAFPQLHLLASTFMLLIRTYVNVNDISLLNPEKRLVKPDITGLKVYILRVQLRDSCRYTWSDYILLGRWSHLMQKNAEVS